jgi:hypothetical protein
MDKNIDKCYAVYVYCEAKNQLLKRKKDRFGLCFDDIIYKIQTDRFLVIENFSKKYPNQNVFLVYFDGYPIICPYEKRGQVFRLITLFPDRRLR